MQLAGTEPITTAAFDLSDANIAPAGATIQPRFADGRLADFRAGEGADAFRRWIATDEGANWLGGFGLVGQDSPATAQHHLVITIE